MTGGATAWARCATLGIQTCRRVESLVVAVTLALGPYFTEPVGCKQ